MPEPLTSRPDSIFVIGMHRSGTSALTRTLHLLGYRIPNKLVRANEFNKRGFWEPQALVQANDEILRAHQRHWADPKPLDLSIGHAAKAERVAAQTARGYFAKPHGTVFKDPRLSRTLPYWKDILSGSQPPRVIMALRNPLEVAHSSARSAGIRLDHALRLWQTYTLEAEFHSRGMARALMRYDALLEDWRSALGSFVELDVPGAHPDAVDQFLSRSLRHQSVTDEALGAHPDIPDGVKALYALLRSPGTLDGKTEAMDELRKAWQSEWSSEAPVGGVSHYVHRLPYWNVQHAKRLLESGKGETAVKFAKRACDQVPDSVDYRRFYARILLGQGQVDEALVELEKLVETLPDEAELRMAIAAALHRNGDSSAAEAHVSTIAKPTSDQLVFLGNLRLAQGLRDSALEAFERAVELSPKHAAANKAVTRLRAAQV